MVVRSGHTGSEAERVAALRRSGLTGEHPTSRLDQFVAHAGAVLGRAYAFLALVDAEREIVRYGDARLRGVCERVHGIAAAALDDAAGRVVAPDLRGSHRFAHHPAVGDPVALRSVAGAVVIDRDGYRLGALCAGDDRPRAFAPNEMAQLAALAAEAGQLIESVRVERQATRDLVGDLCAAAAAAQLPLAFQPIWRAVDLRLAGCEALLRWRNRLGGPVSPDALLSTFERLGLARTVDDGVLASALLIARGWPAPLRLGVNVSGHWFDLPGRTLADTVSGALAQSGFSPAQLLIEVTERVVIRDQARAIEELAALRALGVQVALDDFGTGWSSLSSLAALPLDVVKLDRSFVGRLPADRRAAALIRGVTELGHALGLAVCVEGIETAEQLAELRDLGCDLLQGFLLGPPSSDVGAVIANAVFQPA